MANTICLDFQMFPVKTKMSLPFNLAGFNFDKVGGGLQPFISQTKGVKGLQFSDKGISIGLAQPASSVRLNLGEFATPITITISGPGMKPITAVTNWQNTFNTQTFTIKLGRANVVVLTKGNNEGILAAICTTIAKDRPLNRG